MGWWAVMKTGNSIFLFNIPVIFYCSCNILLLLFHCCELYWLASARIRPQRRDEEEAPQQCALTRLVGSSLFTAVKGGQGCAWGGCHRDGWSEQVPSTKFLPETTACLVTPLFLQIKIVCTLINKLYLGLAALLSSAMEIFQRERKYVYM